MNGGARTGSLSTEPTAGAAANSLLHKTPRAMQRRPREAPWPAAASFIALLPSLLALLLLLLLLLLWR